MGNRVPRPETYPRHYVDEARNQSFAGREVHFRVNGVAVVETKAWQLGGADVNPFAILSLLGD